MEPQIPPAPPFSKGGIIVLFILLLLSSCGGGGMYSNEAEQEALPDLSESLNTNCTTDKPCKVTVTKNAFLMGSDFPADIVIPDISGIADTAFVVTTSSPAGVIPIDLGTNPFSLSDKFAAFNAPAGTGYPSSLFIRDASRAFLLTSSHIIDFNPTSGSVNATQTVNFKIGLPQPLKDSTGKTVSELVPAYPSSIVYADSKLYVTTSNYINPLTPASAAPGTVLVFNVSDAAPFVSPRTYIITTDYIPSGLTTLSDGNIAVTNSGISDLVNSHAEPKTNSSIDIVSTQTNKVVQNISIGKVGLSFQELAVTNDGKRGFIGSISYGEVYEVDFTSGTAVRTHANPVTISGNSLGSDYLTAQGLSPDDKYLFVASFEKSAIYPIDISVDPPKALPGHFTEEPFIIGFPAGVTQDNPSGANTGAGPFVVRSSYPDIIATTGYPGTIVAIGTGYLGEGDANGEAALTPNEATYEPPLDEPPPNEPPPIGDGSNDPEKPESCNGFAVAIKEIKISSNGGFGHAKLPQVLLGPPEPVDGTNGQKGTAGSVNGVVSLGTGGSIVLDMGECEIVDGDGPDLIVFENAFFTPPDPALPGKAVTDPDSVSVFSEPGKVSISSDGVTFKDFPCNFVVASSGSFADKLESGCAGITPTLYGKDPLIAGLEDGAGGDAFDLADIGVKKARYVKITSRGTFVAPADPANLGNGATGFDLDAVAVVNGEK